MVRTWCFHCWGQSLISGQGTKILHSARCNQKKKKKKIEISSPYIVENTLVVPNCLQNKVNPLTECNGHDIFWYPGLIPRKTTALRSSLGGAVVAPLNSPWWELLVGKAAGEVGFLISVRMCRPWGGRNQVAALSRGK